jgi:hypothetical protein
MAKRKSTAHVSTEKSQNLFYDGAGHLRYRIGFVKREREKDDGDSVERTAEHALTGQGTYVSLASLMREGPDRVVLQVCDACEREVHSLFCHNPSRITCSPAAEMTRCRNCSASLCGRHYFVSRHDGRPRCRRCHRWHWIWECIIKPLLWIQGK